MTFNLLLLNEFPDEEADRAGGRRNLVILLGRAAAAHLYVALGSMVPISLMAGAVVGALPWTALAAVVPSLLLLKPARWAFAEPESPVPVPALGANVAWNLLTNLVLALAFLVSLWMG
jgi:1,4-dihydroxy-2-naphthoate octaprenyltransferase